MNVEVLHTEIKHIITKSTSYVFPDIKVTLFNGIDEIPVATLITYRINSNFNTNISDIIYLEFMHPMGDFLKRIYPNRDSLDVRINVKFDKKQVSRTFKALIMNELPEEHDSKLANADKTTLDEQTLERISLQCVDPLTLELKDVTTSGIYHDVTITKILKGVIGSHIDNITVLGKKIDYKLNIYDLDNKKVYNNLYIKPNTKVIKIPYEFQNNDYGLYEYGVGIYFTNINTVRNTILYDISIFPLYDITRYKRDTKQPKLMLISPAVRNLDKNTYNAYYDNGVYKLIVSNITFRDDNNKARYKSGTGIIETFSDIHINDSLSLVTDNQILFNSIGTFSKKNIDTDTYGHAKYVETDFDSNVFKYKSSINLTRGRTVIVKLKDINSDFIFQGMSLEYMFIKENKVVTLYGIVQGVDTTYNISSKESITVILFFIQRETL